MIQREGGSVDERHGSVWVVLKHDAGKKRTVIEIKDKKDGKILARNGQTGPRAKAYYDKLNKYFFRDE